jgi:hypothetical protein
LSWP